MHQNILYFGFKRTENPTAKEWDGMIEWYHFTSDKIELAHLPVCTHTNQTGLASTFIIFFLYVQCTHINLVFSQRQHSLLKLFCFAFQFYGFLFKWFCSFLVSFIEISYHWYMNSEDSIPTTAHLSVIHFLVQANVWSSGCSSIFRLFHKYSDKRSQRTETEAKRERNGEIIFLWKSMKYLVWRVNK